MDRTIRTGKASRAKKSRKYGRFPISAKLTLISTVLSLLFLSAIIALAARLTNARGIARENNRAINNLTALAVESELESVYSGAMSLLRKIDEAGGADADSVASANEIAERFFTLNPTIKAVAILPEISQTRLPGQAVGEASAAANPMEVRDALGARLFVNNLAKTIGHDHITLWFENQKETARRALSGEILMCHAAPFSDAPLLVMLFPYERGAEINAAAVFFSPEPLVRSLGTGDNASFMSNEAGDVLLQAEDGGNSDDLPFIQWQTPEHGSRSFTSTYHDGEGTECFAAIKKIAVNQRDVKNENNLVVITTFKTDIVFKKLVTVIRLMCCFGGGALVLSSLLAHLYTKTISKPLVALIHGANSVREGDYAVNLANRSGDEIGELTQSFISMTQEAAYVEKFANKTALRLARQEALFHAGKGATTVCFVKLRAFAELTGNLSARDTAALANEFFSCLTRCVTHAGGVVDKFLTHDGAALLAFWGALEDGGSERNAMNCIHAALMMRASLRKLNKERLLRVKAAQSEAPYPAQSAQFAPLIKMSCVVNTGETFAGIISVDERKELMVAGDVVSLAECIADANEDFDTDILIMEHTRELIGERFVLEETPLIKVKGREKPLRTFALVNVQSDDEAGAILQEAETPDMETARLWAGVAGPRTMAEVRERW
ncbi:MAG: HAMP domain-containing protein [Treponema sp.]|jgi:adenylate cyclase|nr:HAMP domain-containing protein [Treponema sp.]